MIYIGADHRGFNLKEELKQKFTEEGVEITDLGDDRLEAEDDYVDFAKKVAEEVTKDPENKGILLCGSGAGVDIVANKIDGIRSALVQDVERAKQAREHEDANVLSLPADILDLETAWQISKTFLETPFSGDARHVRRLEKLEEVEQNS